MKISIRYLLTALLLAAIIAGCSGGGSNPIAPPQQNLGNVGDDIPLAEGDILTGERDFEGDAVAQLATVGDTFQSLGLIGAYDFMLDSDNLSGELTSVRKVALGESYLVSGASFFTVRPCIECLRLESVELLTDGTIRALFMIDHPFEKGDRAQPPSGLNRLDLDLFDLAMVIVPYSASMKTFEHMDLAVYPKLVIGADGYTRELANLTNNPHVYPYYLVIDDTENTEPTYNRFEMGMKDIPIETKFSGNGLFRIYLTAGYGASATFETRLSPVYYNPEYNRKEAWKVEVIPPQGDDPPSPANTWTAIDSTTEHEVTVKVWDWQQTATVSPDYPDYENQTHIYKASRVDRVSVEIQGMARILKWVTNPESGDGSPDNPMIFKIGIANENLLSEGEYFGLVKVADERVPPSSGDIGEVDSLVHSFNGKDLYWYWLPEFATYQVFKATVVGVNDITVTNPNGGEAWTVGEPATITWTSSGSISNVNIALSLDGGANYTIPIVNNTPNTGSYNIPSVGNWLTSQARIQVSDALDASVNDESDANFVIEEEESPIRVIKPNGGETWPKETQQEIQWETTDPSIQYVKIEYSKDSGVSYTGIVTGSTQNDGSHLWNVPEAAVGTQTRVKVSKLTDSSMFDESDADFTIICPIPEPPQTVNATDGLYPDKVVVSWSNVAAADSYNIYKNSILEQANYNGLSWEDLSAVPGETYHYQISSVNSCGEGVKAPADPGEAGSACVLPTTPTNVVASDGTYTDHVEVTWTTVVGASGYNIYRDLSATPIATNVPAPPWNDTAVTLCQNYTYEVTADSTCGESGKSLSDVGYSEEFPLEILNISATDDSYPDKVTITWDSDTAATTYNIYRDTLLLQADVGDVVTFDDTTATPGVIYSYQVEGENTCGTGPISVPDTGSACILPIDPTNVSATDGDFGDRVRLTWDSVAGATGYNIYKDSILEVNNYAGTSWDDMTVTPGVTYYYQVEALNSCGPSNIVPADPGEPGNPCVIPDPPTGLTATDGSFNDRVQLSWTAATGATSYNIYRDSAFLINVPGTTHDDMTITQGVVYTYEIESLNACGPSATYSAPDDGHAFACTADTNSTCDVSERLLLTDTASGCVDQIDEDWFDVYTTPNGLAGTSTIDLTIPAGTLDIYVYGLEPGGGACPGNLITSVINTGTTTVTIPADPSSHIYIRLIGNSGEVMYTMDTYLDPVLTNVPIEICVATDDGTPTGNWPFNGTSYLDLTILNNMINWANNFWGQYGYHFDWDGVTVTIMDAQYYVNDNQVEENQMHATYHTTGVLSLYFVQQLFSGNTAYCWTRSPQSNHRVDNVYTVYSPNVWNWQAVVAHEQGHGVGYYFDEYLYSMYGCACGDNGCLGYTPYLYWNDYGCYNGNLMYYDVGWTWDQYELNIGQNEFIHIFHFNNPTNFPWF